MDEVLGQVSNVLRHPFVLALVTALFVNGLTRTWQDRQKAFEIGTGLVAAMSEATTKALLAADRASRVLQPVTLEADAVATVRPPSDSSADRRRHLDELRTASETWERDSAVLGTKLEAYYPSNRATRRRMPQIANEWTRFRHKVTGSMSDAAAGNLGHQRWQAELKSLYQTKARLIRLVLDERPAGFDRGWLPWRNPRGWPRSLQRSDGHERRELEAGRAVPHPPAQHGSSEVSK